MSDDAIECRVRFWTVPRHRTHRIVCDGITIGHFYTDGSLEIEQPPDEPPSAAPPVRASDDG